MLFVSNKKIADLAESRVDNKAYGRVFALQYIGVWVGERGEGKAQFRRTRRRLREGVMKPTTANQKEKATGYDMAEQLLTDARKELLKRKRR